MEAAKQIYMVDSRGLVTAERKADLAHHKLSYAHEGLPVRKTPHPHTAHTHTLTPAPHTAHTAHTHTPTYSTHRTHRSPTPLPDTAPPHPVPHMQRPRTLPTTHHEGLPTFPPLGGEVFWRTNPNVASSIRR